MSEAQRVDFQGSDHSAAVLGVDAGGRFGVDGGQARVEVGVASRFGLVVEVSADGFVAPGAVKEAAEQGLQIKRRAADQA